MVVSCESGLKIVLSKSIIEWCQCITIYNLIIYVIVLSFFFLKMQKMLSHKGGFVIEASNIIDIGELELKILKNT